MFKLCKKCNKSNKLKIKNNNNKVDARCAYKNIFILQLSTVNIYFAGDVLHKLCLSIQDVPFAAQIFKTEKKIKLFINK